MRGPDLIWTPDHGLPDGARARDWLREQRRRERYRWRHVRDPRLERQCAAPTLVAYSETSDWTAGSATKTAAASWQTNDVLVVIAGCEDSVTLGTPTGTGLTFSKTEAITGANHCNAFAATATAAGTNSGNISVTNSSSTLHWGFGVWVWSSSQGPGNHAQQVTATKTKALTPVGANAGICWGIFDFNADTAPTGSPTPSNVRQSAQQAGRYTRGVFDLLDQVSSGSVSYGQTGGGTTGPFSIVIQEVQNDGGGGGATFLPAANLPVLQAVKRASYF